jgi:hypothetical protein
LHGLQCSQSPHVHSRVRWAHRAVAAGVVTNPEPITSQSCGRSTKPRSRPSRRRRRRPKCSHGSTRSRPPSCARHHRAYRLELPRSSACQHTRFKRRRPWPRRPRPWPRAALVEWAHQPRHGSRRGTSLPLKPGAGGTPDLGVGRIRAYVRDCRFRRAYEPEAGKMRHTRRTPV